MAASPASLRELLEAIERSLADLRARTERPGLMVASRAIQGDPALEICEVARQAGHDLIVMGTHGRTGLTRLFLGSVAERVIREAPCPVLVVRPKSA